MKLLAAWIFAVVVSAFSVLVGPIIVDSLLTGTGAQTPGTSIDISGMFATALRPLLIFAVTWVVPIALIGMVFVESLRKLARA